MLMSLVGSDMCIRDIGITTLGLGSSDFARHYFRNRFYFLFLRVLRCFSSPGSLPRTYVFSTGYRDITRDEFPHSDICGSLDVCSSPQLFAAYHVLLRRHMPRHPPWALRSLIFFLLVSRYKILWLLLNKTFPQFPESNLIVLSC